jgi:hypothetical protein
MMIIGGLIARPTNFWVMSVTAGLFYILSFFYMYSQFTENGTAYILKTLSFSFLPGLIPVIMGLQLRKTYRKYNGV